MRAVRWRTGAFGVERRFSPRRGDRRPLPSAGGRLRAVPVVVSDDGRPRRSAGRAGHRGGLSAGKASDMRLHITAVLLLVFSIVGSAVSGRVLTIVVPLGATVLIDAVVPARREAQ